MARWSTWQLQVRCHTTEPVPNCQIWSHQALAPLLSPHASGRRRGSAKDPPVSDGRAGGRGRMKEM
ncbi:hypothetical protein E2C01_077688 [Portunus trituberculatus]|uniref:Uncharacterized protein n=1 Tax=Portunus trituberculatus TaxID=210409 RepID=A0A5B7ILZ5_PORTR|nr:hypothetical protein [Portunus trituberculatus]